MWWRKSTACWGSHCPRKAGTGSPKGLGPAVAAATVAGAPGRFTTAAARQLPPELADTPKMQSMLEASLDKICLLLGRKAMINLDTIIKSRDITLLTKVSRVKAMVIPVVRYGCESWIMKKAES